MSDCVFVVRNKQGEYLANRFNHRTWTKSLAQAKYFLTKQDVEAAAIINDAAIVLVELNEIAELTVERMI